MADMTKTGSELSSGKRQAEMPCGRRAKILLADDHTLLGLAFEKLLSPEYDVLGLVEDGRALLKAVEKHRPDIVLLDISMPRLNGLDAAHRLQKSHPDCKLIFLTMNDDPELAAEAFRIGALGYLLKTSAPNELFQAIEQVIAGRSYITPLIAQGMVKSIMRQPDTQDREVSITARQREVLQLLAEGGSMKEVAKALDVSPRTVAYHKYLIMEKLGLKSNAELIRFAIKKGLVAV